MVADWMIRSNQESPIKGIDGRDWSSNAAIIRAFMFEADHLAIEIPDITRIALSSTSIWQPRAALVTLWKRPAHLSKRPAALLIDALLAILVTLLPDEIPTIFTIGSISLSLTLANTVRPAGGVLLVIHEPRHVLGKCA
jgi:hypothetical protein